MENDESGDARRPLWVPVVMVSMTLVAGFVLGWIVYGLMMNSMMDGMMSGDMMNGMGMMHGNGGQRGGGMRPMMCEQVPSMLLVNSGKDNRKGTEPPSHESFPPSDEGESQATRSSGRELYTRYCASCHGQNLAGDPPRVPSLEQVGQRRSKEFIRQRIRQGKGMMPPFRFLSVSQQKSIVSYLMGETDTAVEDVELPLPKLGDVLFASNCASCHRKRTTDTAPQGIPRGMMGMKMMEPAPLAGTTKRFTRTQFVEILNWGPMYMPSFRHFSLKDKQALWAYVLTLEGEGEAPRPTMMEMMIRICGRS